MSQLTRQSNSVRVTRRCTRKARIQETGLKLSSKTEAKRAHKTIRELPLTEQQRGAARGKLVEMFRVGEVLQKQFFPSVTCQGETQDLRFTESN